MSDNNGYRIASGNTTGDKSTTAALFAAVAGKTLAVKNVTLTNSGTTEQTITIEKADGTNLIGPIYMEANETVQLGPYGPGSYQGDSGAAINVLASTSNVITANGECYVL